MKRKMIPLLISAICFTTGSFNSFGAVSAVEEEMKVPVLMGDVNSDGNFNVADVVTFQKWMLGCPDAELSNWKAADFCKDEVLNVFDLCLMKRALIEKMSNSPELDDPEIREILFGDNFSGSGSGKPTSSLKIAMKCKAYSSFDDALTVDVAKLGFDQPQDYDGNSFVYEYGIYPCELCKPIEDKSLIINGEKGCYKKEYNGKDREIFMRGIEYDDYATYHHETASLDFRDKPIGSSGCIAFMFKAMFLNEDGTLPAQPQSEGDGKCMYYYVGENGVGISNVSEDDAKKAFQTMGVGEISSYEQYTGRWHGKNISRELFEALKNPDGEPIPIMCSFKDTGANEFIYKGKTLREYTDALFGEDISKLEELLEQGDVIKYGEKCYTTGTPDGIKWTKSLYDFRVEFYGEELLSKYIVNGEFLKEHLQADLTALKEYYRAAQSEAVDAFCQARIEETIKFLKGNGITGERIPDTHNMLMYVTAAEFEKLSLENVSYYDFFKTIV